MANTGRKWSQYDRDRRPLRNIFINYIGLPYSNIYDIVKDSPIDGEHELPKVQCSYINPKTNIQCITLLSSSSQTYGSGRCNLHTDIEREVTYSINDSLWKCTVIVPKKNGRLMECRKPAENRTVVDGKETIRCPEHHKLWLEFNA